MNHRNNPFENKRKQHFSLRKLSVGLASVLLSTTVFYGTQVSEAHASSDNGDQTSDQSNANHDPVAESSLNIKDANQSSSDSSTDTTQASSSDQSTITAKDLKSNDDQVTLGNSNNDNWNISLSFSAKKNQKVTVEVPYIFTANTDQDDSLYTTTTTKSDATPDFNTTKTYQNTTFEYTMKESMNYNWNIALKKAIDNWSLLPAGKEYDVVIKVDGVEQKRIKYVIGSDSSQTGGGSGSSSTQDIVNRITAADIVFDHNQKTNLVKGQKYIAGVKLSVNNPDQGAGSGSFTGTISVKVPKGFSAITRKTVDGQWAYGFIPNVTKLGDDFTAFNTLTTGRITITQDNPGDDIKMQFDGIDRNELSKGIFAFWGIYTGDVSAADNNFSASVDYQTNASTGETSAETYTTKGSAYNVKLATATTQNAHLQVGFNNSSQEVYTDNCTTASHQKNTGLYQYPKPSEHDTLTLYNDGNVAQTNVKLTINVEPGSVLIDDSDEKYRFLRRTTSENVLVGKENFIEVVLNDGKKIVVSGNNGYTYANSNYVRELLTQDMINQGLAADGSNIKQIIINIFQIQPGTKIDFEFGNFSILSSATSKKAGDTADYSYSVTSDQQTDELTGKTSLKIVDPTIANRSFVGSTVFNSGTYQPASDETADMTWGIRTDNYTPIKNQPSSYLIAVPKGFKIKDDATPTIVGGDGQPVAGATITKLGNIGLNGELMFRVDLPFVPGGYLNTNDGNVLVKATLIPDRSASGSKYYYGWYMPDSGDSRYKDYTNLAGQYGTGMSLVMAINDQNIYIPGRVNQPTEGTSITLLDGKTYSVIKQDVSDNSNTNVVGDRTLRYSTALYDFIYPSTFGDINGVNTDSQTDYDSNANIKYSDDSTIQTQLGKTTGNLRLTNIISSNGSSAYAFNFVPLDQDHLTITGAGTITPNGNAKATDGTLYYYFGDATSFNFDSNWNATADPTKLGFETAEQAQTNHGSDWLSKVTGVLLKTGQMSSTSRVDAVIPYAIKNITGSGVDLTLNSKFTGDHNGQTYTTNNDLHINVGRYVRQTTNDYVASVDDQGNLVIDATPAKTSSKIVKVGSDLTFDQLSDTDLASRKAMYYASFA